MSEAEVWLVRHGQTAWSRDGKHTSRTDVPLTPAGEKAAAILAERLNPAAFDLVLTSPLQRARHTARLAGFPEAQVEPDLVEWDYGEYEGVTTPDILRTVPGWSVWSHPVPGGETAEEVRERLDGVVARLRDSGGRVLCFGHGHALRVLTARWLGQPVADGRFY